MSSPPPPPPPLPPPPPPPSPGVGAPPPPAQPTPTGRGGRKAWLLIGTAVLAIVVLAVAATGSGDEAPQAQAVDPLPAAAPTTDTDLDSDPASPSDPSSSEPVASTPSTDPPTTMSSEAGTVAASGDADEVDDVSSCTWTGDEVTIALVNDSSKTSTYWVTTAYLDGNGNRVADEIHFVNAVRPNETAIEATLSLEHPTPSCEVIDVQRWAEVSDPAEMSEIGACQLGAPDVFGHATGSLTARNGSSEISDYTVGVAFVNPVGFRIGSGTTIIESVRPGESAPGDVFSFAAPEGIAACDVVAVERTASR